MISAAETYFAALADIHATGGGVQETVVLKNVVSKPAQC